MKKYIPALMILVATSHLQASTITAEDEAAGKWTRKFKVKGGKITHTPESIVIESGGFSLNSPGYSFAKNSALNKMKAKKDGAFKIAMTIDRFRKEVKKFGSIISESK